LPSTSWSTSQPCCFQIDIQGDQSLCASDDYNTDNTIITTRLLASLLGSI
jgi:hypothetical protein